MTGGSLTPRLPCLSIRPCISTCSQLVICMYAYYRERGRERIVYNYTESYMYIICIYYVQCNIHVHFVYMLMKFNTLLWYMTLHNLNYGIRCKYQASPSLPESLSPPPQRTGEKLDATRSTGRCLRKGIDLSGREDEGGRGTHRL